MIIAFRNMICVLVIVLSACSSNSQRPGIFDAAVPSMDAAVPSMDAAAAPQSLRVLFIGNSYTAVNDLPSILQTLGESPISNFTFEVAKHTPGGQTWEGHDRDPEVDAKISEGWDFVVLQDQSQQAFDTRNIKASLRSLEAKVRAVGAEPILFMTWARDLALFDAPREIFRQNMLLTQYYERHAEVIGGRVAPVGRAWERALRDPIITLHTSDGSHPNAQGSYLAACVLYGTITRQTPVGLQADLSLETNEVGRLQKIAWETLLARKLPEKPLLGYWPFTGELGNDVNPSIGLVTAARRRSGSSENLDFSSHFGFRNYAALPYFPGLNSAHVTVSIDAYRADWSAPLVENEYLVGKWQGYELYQSGTMLSAQVYTTKAVVAPEVCLKDGCTPPIRYSVNALSPGWHHIAMTYDGSTYTLWVDYNQVAAGTTDGDLQYYLWDEESFNRYNGVAISGPPYFGDLSVRESNPFTGALANLRIYDQALSGAEMQERAVPHSKMPEL